MKGLAAVLVCAAFVAFTPSSAQADHKEDAWAEARLATHYHHPGYSCAYHPGYYHVPPGLRRHWHKHHKFYRHGYRYGYGYGRYPRRPRGRIHIGVTIPF
jgi:hypothetical protein